MKGTCLRDALSTVEFVVFWSGPGLCRRLGRVDATLHIVWVLDVASDCG